MTDNLNLGAIDLGTDDEFIARHIGPRAADTQAMLQRLGYDSLDALIGNVIPDSIKGSSVLDLPAGMGEAEALASLKAIAAGNRALRSFIGQGYYQLPHPGTDPAQPLGEPGLVHRLHAVPAGNLPGPPGGAAELPDPGQRPVQPADRQRLDARRGDRRRRGHDLLQASVEEPHQPGILRLPPLPPADPRRAAHPCRAAGHRGGGRRRERHRRLLRLLRRVAAIPHLRRRDRRLSRTGQPLPCGRCAGRGGRRPAGADPADPAGRVRRRRSHRQRPALRRAARLRRPRTRPISPPATPSSGTCRDAWSASPSTATASRPTAWPCRPASSTSAARRPPATSAPPRCCWPTSPACSPSTTARRACCASPGAPTG